MSEHTEHEHRHSPEGEAPRVHRRKSVWRVRLWWLFVIWFAVGLIAEPWRGREVHVGTSMHFGRAIHPGEMHEINQPVLALTVYLPAAGMIVLWMTRPRRRGVPVPDDV